MSYFALTGFPSCRSQSFLSTSTYVSLIGSGEGRHTTHLLKCVLLLSTSQTDWKQSSDVLSDISCDILSVISSDISSGILSDISFHILFDISSAILSDICFDILSDISSDILSDISFDVLSDISSDIISDISKTKHSIHSFTHKPLHKLYIYLTPRSKLCVCQMAILQLHSIASDRPAKKQLSPKMQKAYVCIYT